MTRNDHNGMRPENRQGGLGEHFDEASLLLYLDGELGDEDSAQVKAHLLCCGECQRLEAELAKASVAFSSVHREADNELGAPPRNWAGFEQRLTDLLSDEPAAPQPARRNVLSGVWSKWRESTTIVPWAFATAAAGLLFAYLWLHAPTARTLSANDVLARAEQRRVDVSLRGPVIYRKLRISDSTAPDAPITVEEWKRTSDGNFKELQTSQPDSALKSRLARQAGQRRAQGAVQDSAPETAVGLLAQLNEVYAANHLDRSEPVSAGEYQKWVGSEGSADQRIVRETLPGGGEAFRLIARAKSPLHSASENALSEMQLLVRSSDWHAIAERLTVQAARGVRTFEVAELEYRELPLNAIPRSIFEPSAPGRDLAGDLPPAVPGPLPLSGPSLAVAVLDRLDAADALVKDQVAVSRVGTEGLKVEGTVGSDQRKSEILAALGPLASSPAVEFDLVSPSDARDRLPHAPSGTLKVQSVQVPPDAGVPESRLRTWLAEHRGLTGSQLDAEAERFQTQALVLSTDIQLQAQALKRIVSVAPSAPADPESGQKWRRMVSRHSDAILQKIKALKQHLEPVFPEAAGVHGPGSLPPESSAYLKPQTDRLEDLATTSDHVLWLSFSGKASESDQHQLTEPKFWQMLGEEDSLATQISRENHP